MNKTAFNFCSDKRFACGLVLLLFFYVYGIHFTFLPTYTSRLIVAFAWCYLGVLFLLRPINYFETDLAPIIIAYISFLLWGIVCLSFSSQVDYAVPKSILLVFLHSFTGGIFFALLFGKRNLLFREVIWLIHLVILLQGILIIVYFVSIDFRGVVSIYIPASGNINYEENLFQSRGLTHSSGATLSLVQAIGILFWAYLVSTVRLYSKGFIYYIVSLGILFLSVLLTGRTGFLIFPFVLCYLMIMLLLNKRISKSIFVFILLIPVGIFGSYVGLTIGYESISDGITMASGEDVFDRLNRFVTSEFISSDGRLQSRTARELLNHWILPQDFKTFLVGDLATWETNRLSSDVGYVRILHAVGLIGLILCYLFFFIIFLYMAINMKGRREKYLIIFFGLLLFLTDAKEPFLLKLQINSVVFVLFCYTVHSRYRKYRYENPVCY